MTFYIQNAKTGFVLDIETFDGNTGKVILWKPHGGTNQLWTIGDNKLIKSQHREGYVDMNSNFASKTTRILYLQICIGSK